MSDEAPENLIQRQLDDMLGTQNDIEALAEQQRRDLRDTERRLSDADQKAHRLRLALYVLDGCEADDAQAEKDNRARRREIREGKR